VHNGPGCQHIELTRINKLHNDSDTRKTTELTSGTNLWTNGPARAIFGNSAHKLRRNSIGKVLLIAYNNSGATNKTRTEEHSNSSEEY
jgi:hypothetical protein